MKAYFYLEICLFLCSTIISCSTHIGLRNASGRTGTLYRQVQHIDKLLKQDCPGSKVQEYVGNAGEIAVLIFLNRLQAGGQSTGVHSTHFPKCGTKTTQILKVLRLELQSIYMKESTCHLRGI